MTNQETAKDFDGVEVETGDDPVFSVIWLHGLGADGHDFLPIVPEISLPCQTRFVFPHAPVRPVTINGGYRMRAWYDILSFERGARQDEAGIEASAAMLRSLVGREQAKGIAPANIVLAGFSQGGAVALHTMLTGSESFAGVLALSTYLPLGDTLFHSGRRVNCDVPVWMGHGLHDPLIDVAVAEASCNAMRSAGVTVDWHTYPMPHSLCPDEVRDIAAWLAAIGPVI